MHQSRQLLPTSSGVSCSHYTTYPAGIRTNASTLSDRPKNMQRVAAGDPSVLGIPSGITAAETASAAILPPSPSVTPSPPMAGQQRLPPTSTAQSYSYGYNLLNSSSNYGYNSLNSIINNNNNNISSSNSVMDPISGSLYEPVYTNDYGQLSPASPNVTASTDHTSQQRHNHDPIKPPLPNNRVTADALCTKGSASINVKTAPPSTLSKGRSMTHSTLDDKPILFVSVDPSRYGPGEPYAYRNEKRPKRFRATAEQGQLLMEAFCSNHTPDLAERSRIATAIGMPMRTVQVWFQNKRSKMRSLERAVQYIRTEPTLLPQSLHDPRGSGSITVNTSKKVLRRTVDAVKKLPALQSHRTKIPSGRSGITATSSSSSSSHSLTHTPNPPILGFDKPDSSRYPPPTTALPTTHAAPAAILTRLSSSDPSALGRSYSSGISTGDINNGMTHSDGQSVSLPFYSLIPLEGGSSSMPIHHQRLHQDIHIQQQQPHFHSQSYPFQEEDAIAMQQLLQQQLLEQQQQQQQQQQQSNSTGISTESSTASPSATSTILSGPYLASSTLDSLHVSTSPHSNAIQSSIDLSPPSSVLTMSGLFSPFNALSTPPHVTPADMNASHLELAYRDLLQQQQHAMLDLIPFSLPHHASQDTHHQPPIKDSLVNRVDDSALASQQSSLCTNPTQNPSLRTLFDTHEVMSDFAYSQNLLQGTLPLFPMYHSVYPSSSFQATGFPHAFTLQQQPFISSMYNLIQPSTAMQGVFDPAATSVPSTVLPFSQGDIASNLCTELPIG
ncbi:hypothetical protein BASA50_006965 [Batrachochytrium salamandrivorans]|uniref:Homeobox domain-containing protein n=1 Tax=Batrachochytrium salamandrivorans TaxID=1357716 RepID=A0ABQ8F8J2_9FUNG|nr:hypothetical protein BASA50_006965 [Batrachochytrium salamandrivorans]KAJ1344689.1 hypothetical protein BSLG_000212 [Batrachochytrium salamandrivorans]